MADSGIGIAAEDQPRIFEEFSQIDSPLQRKVRGTGLGLPLSRKLAGLLGGSLEVASAPGVGSTIRGSPPAGLPDAARHVAYRHVGRDGDREEPMAEAPRILVVDDTEANRYAVGRHLRQAGYIVSEASDGHRALAMMARELPDLLMVDIRMPGMDGLELVRRVRADPRTMHMPVLQVSASFTDPVSQALGLDSGADGYLTHPVEPLVLLATVRALLRARSAEREARAAEAAWRATFEAIGDGVCVVDPAGCIERWNAAFETIVGGADLLGRQLTAVLPPLRIIPDPPYVALEDGTALQGVEFATDGKRLRATASTMPDGPARSVLRVHRRHPATGRGDSGAAGAATGDRRAARRRDRARDQQHDDRDPRPHRVRHPVRRSLGDDPAATWARSARPRTGARRWRVSFSRSPAGRCCSRSCSTSTRRSPR